MSRIQVTWAVPWQNLQEVKSIREHGRQASGQDRAAFACLQVLYGGCLRNPAISNNPKGMLPSFDIL